VFLLISIFSTLYGSLQFVLAVSIVEGCTGRDGSWVWVEAATYPNSSSAMEILIPLGVCAVYSVISGRLLMMDGDKRIIDVDEMGRAMVEDVEED
jgi:hypothetical protein